MISFPRLGNLTIGLEALFKEINLEYLLPPQLTKQTVSLGCRFAPETACLPFKLVLGNYLEETEMGADVLLMLGGSGPCRFGYFGALHKTILTDLNIPADVIILEPDSLLESLKVLRDMAGVSSKRLAQGLYLGWKKLQSLDQLEMMANEVRATSGAPEDVSKLQDHLVEEIARAATVEAVKKAFRHGRESFHEFALAQNQKPFIGIVGDIYMLNEPFANGQVSKFIGDQGYPVRRSIYLSEWIKQHLLPGLNQYWQAHLLNWAQPYLNHEVGGHGLDSVAWTMKYLNQDCGGIIHILPMTCMPEIVAQSVWPSIIQDYHKPILSLVLDEHAADVGVNTRIEAFLEMVEFRTNGLPPQKSSKESARASWL